MLDNQRIALNSSRLRSRTKKIRGTLKADRLVEPLENRSLLSAGALDTMFGTGGIANVLLPQEVDTHGRTILVQSDGRIIEAGWDRNTADQPLVYGQFVTRLNPDGSYDQTFALDGRAHLFDGESLVNGFVSPGEGAALQPSDGKIVLAGNQAGHLALARLNPNGSLDTGFGANGVATSPFEFQADKVLVQSTGKIVVAGTYFDSGTSQYEVAVVRFNTDGSFDTSFGGGSTGGLVITAGGTTHDAILVGADQVIVAAGELIRYSADGTVDTSFGSSGTGTVPTSQTVLGLVPQPTGDIVEVGTANLIAFTSQGIPDPGVPSAPVPSGLGLYAVAPGLNGKIVGMGLAAVGSGVSDMEVVRFNPDLTLDNTFNPSGTTPGVVTQAVPLGFFFQVFAAGTYNDSVERNVIACQGDGSILTSTVAPVDTAFNQAGMLKFASGGTVDTSFGTSGVVLATALAPGSSDASSVALQPDGKILAAGITSSELSNSAPGIGREAG